MAITMPTIYSEHTASGVEYFIIDNCERCTVNHAAMLQMVAEGYRIQPVDQRGMDIEFDADGNIKLQDPDELVFDAMKQAHSACRPAEASRIAEETTDQEKERLRKGLFRPTEIDKPWKQQAMKIGYARTSTFEQIAGLEAQIAELKERGAEKIFSERVSSLAERGELQRAMDFVREGDTLMVTKLDRLARSVANFIEITQALKIKGVAISILSMGVDSSTPTGQLMFNILASFAEFERDLMLERQRHGIAKGKAEGNYKGRKPKAFMQADKIRELALEGRSTREISKLCNISMRSTSRVLSAHGLRKRTVFVNGVDGKDLALRA